MQLPRYPPPHSHSFTESVHKDEACYAYDWRLMTCWYGHEWVNMFDKSDYANYFCYAIYTYHACRFDYRCLPKEAKPLYLWAWPPCIEARGDGECAMKLPFLCNAECIESRPISSATENIDDNTLRMDSGQITPIYIYLMPDTRWYDGIERSERRNAHLFYKC